MQNHTQTQYMSLAQAFDYLNQTLFASSPLPSVLVTFQRHANSRGYFAAGMFESRESGASVTTSEIALNPDEFVGRSDLEIFSTLAHEMVHLWQATHGKAPSRAYHDRQWADKMQAIGLMPSDTGAPGGKTTGARMTHYVINDGPFHRAFLTLEQRNIKIAWQSAPRDPAAKKKSASKTKFTCAMCGQNAWGKPTIAISCMHCDMPMLPDDVSDTGEGETCETSEELTPV